MIQSTILTYGNDGPAMRSELFYDASIDSARPGILVFPDVFGFGHHVVERARRLAGLGYAALACDLHGDGRRFESIEDVMPLMQRFREEPEFARARAAAALAALQGAPQVDVAKIVATGYCLGGTMALELARSGAALVGVVGFHCGLETARQEDAQNITGKVLVCLGADDPTVPAEQRAAFETEMRNAGIDWRMHLYGGVVHSFTSLDADAVGKPDFIRYDRAADQRSWTEMLALIDEVAGTSR